MLSPLFRLPREIRDHIYSYLFEDGSAVVATFPSTLETKKYSWVSDTTSCSFDLKLRRFSPVPTSNANVATLEHECDDLVWLLACKQIYREGREAFSRTPLLEWLFDAGKSAVAKDDSLAWTTSLTLPTNQTTNLRINLAQEHFKIYYKEHERDIDAYGDLLSFWNLLYTHDLRLQRFRIYWHTNEDDHKFRERRLTQTKLKFVKYLKDLFRDVQAEVWQFGFGETSHGLVRGDLYELSGPEVKIGNLVNVLSRGPEMAKHGSSSRPPGVPSIYWDF